MRNFLAHPTGKAVFRSGTTYVHHTRNHNPAVFIEFQFSDEQAYIIEATDSYFRFYKDNIGYPVSDLKTVLYELAVTYSQNFYLGSLNSKSNEPPYLRQHTHVVIIFPYIDIKGNFQVVVFSRNEKLSLDYLISHWKGNYIHLVQVEASSGFEPSGIDFNPVIRR